MDDDLDLLAGWLADPEVYRWWEGRPLGRDEVADLYTGRRRPEVEPFVIEADGVPARGLGHDAARAASRFLLDQRGWTEVTLDPMVDNIGVIRAFERAGFTPDGEELDDETGKRIIRMVVRREVQDVGPARS